MTKVDNQIIRERPLRSLRDLEFRLGIPREKLRQLADWKSNYSTFEIANEPKPYSKTQRAGKSRTINNPSPELKKVQRRIVARLLSSIPLPDNLFGAVKGRCIKKHALRHLGASTLVTMDIKSFFPSITHEQVFNVWTRIVGCSSEVASLLTKLTTYNYHLPQGAPTSPAISNLFLASLLMSIFERADDMQVKATTWVDDIALSGRDGRLLMEPLRKTLTANNHTDSRKKRKIMGAGDTKSVTGVRLGRYEIRAKKEKIAEVRSGLHHLSVGDETSLGAERDIQRLIGQINHIKSICEKDAESLQQCLDRTLSKHRTLSRAIST